MDAIQEKFLQLVQISMGFRSRFDVAPDEAEWWAILEEAEKQGLTSFLFTGVDRLEDDQIAPFRPRSRFAAKAFRTAGKNAAMDQSAAALSSLFAELGRASCVLKGQGTAMLYEFPERRQCGDIDIWVEGDTAQTVALLKSRWPVGDVVYHHAEVRMLKDVPVEVHFHPTWMNDPFANHRLQRWFEDKAGKGFCHFTEVKGFKVPDTEFNLVFSLVHIFRHIFYEGVGMRQLVDYGHILMHATAEESKSAYDFLCSIHMQKFCAAMMWVMRDCLGLGGQESQGAEGMQGTVIAQETVVAQGMVGTVAAVPQSEHKTTTHHGQSTTPQHGKSKLTPQGKASMLLCEPDEKDGRAIMESVFLGGNFGRHDARNTHKSGEGLIARIIRIGRLRSRFALTYPREILWSPIFKTWQYIWRRSHGYVK